MAPRLTIKAQLHKDIRLLPIHTIEITYDELLLMIGRIFKDTLPSLDNITVKYLDGDNDLVTLTSTEDLSIALAHATKLKLEIFEPKEKDKGDHSLSIVPLMPKQPLSPNEAISLTKLLYKTKSEIDHLISCLSAWAPVTPGTQLSQPPASHMNGDQGIGPLCTLSSADSTSHQLMHNGNPTSDHVSSSSHAHSTTPTHQNSVNYSYSSFSQNPQAQQSYQQHPQHHTYAVPPPLFHNMQQYQPGRQASRISGCYPRQPGYQ